MSGWFEVGTADGFTEDAPTPVHAGGQQIAVFRLGEQLFALKDLCTHGNAKLSDGYVEDGCGVECPLHQGLFDIRSGAPRSAPITEAVRTFPIRVVAGKVEVEVGAGQGDGAGGCSSCAGDSANHPDNADSPTPQRLAVRVAGITRASHDVAILALEHAVGTPLAYRAGQYLDVLLADGVRRSYSMATVPRAGMIELHVRHMPGGRFTDHVFAALQAGDSLQVEGPAGSFWLREGAAPVLLLASGTGFAPVKAMVEQAIAAGLDRPMVLYWGGRARRDLYLHQLCRDWAATYPWFRYVPVLSAATEEDRWEGRHGLVHQAAMQDMPDLSAYQVYACGAPAMVEAARADFTGQCGLPAQAFFADAFLSAADRR